MQFVETFWELLPPIVAIVLALITKEVCISLFVGILAGAFSDGFKQMAPAILILTFAWTLEGICNGCLNLGRYVAIGALSEPAPNG